MYDSSLLVLVNCVLVMSNIYQPFLYIVFLFSSLCLSYSETFLVNCFECFNIFT